MMRTVDEVIIAAAPAVVWPLASAVEHWPNFLRHYRRVTRLDGAPAGDGLVEMAAWRPFGVFRWPTWWRSEMRVNPVQREIYYRHIAGVTRGMQVWWTILPEGVAHSRVTIVHEWDGPPWSVLRRPAAEWVIGPVFVHGIASRTLAGIAKAATR